MTILYIYLIMESKFTKLTLLVILCLIVSSLCFTIDYPYHNLIVGSNITITWKSDNIRSLIDISLIDVTQWKVYTTIATKTEDKQYYRWTIPVNTPCDRQYEFYIQDSKVTTWTYGPCFVMLCSLEKPTHNTNINYLLANIRYLTDDLISSIDDNNIYVDKGIVRSTYKDIWMNVLLSVNMLYEEKLQNEIENDRYFDEAASIVTSLIHQTLNITSINGMQNISHDNTKFRRSRIKWILDYLKPYPYPITELTEDILAKYTENQWIWFIDQYNDSDNFLYTKRIVKVLRMIISQYPYFGGSIEYMFGETDILEYWVYHISTITRDPNRYIPNSNLVKPYIDYRTYSDSLLPIDNQRNLGISITSVEFVDLPYNLREEIVEILTNHRMNSKVDIYHLERTPEYIEVLRGWRDKHNTGINEVEKLWNYLDSNGRRQLYGDILLLPWSNAHLFNGHGDYNVVGIRGNLIETPEEASLKYLDDLNKICEGEYINGNIFIKDDKLVKNPIKKSILVDEFIKFHNMWYNKSYSLCRPITGGISGHTLGYLNLYASAIKLSEHNIDISMETLRFIMIGALTGLKYHHSYDEVLTASVGIPDGIGGILKYNQEGFYVDVINSLDKRISSIANIALINTVNNIKDPVKGSALSYIQLYYDYNKMLPILLNYVNNKVNVDDTLALLRRPRDVCNGRH